MKKFIMISMACFFAVLGLNAQVAPEELPFTVSTNTTDGAVWYMIRAIKTAGSEDGTWDVSINGLGGSPQIKWNSFDPTTAAEGQQFCFIGDNTTGFQVYNKMCLKGKEVPVYKLNANGAFSTPKTLSDPPAVTLEEDLPLHNMNEFNATTGVLIFSDAINYTGTQLLDKFLIWQGDGTSTLTDGKKAPTDQYKFFALDYYTSTLDEVTRPLVANQFAWVISSGSTLTYDKNRGGTGVYAYKFIYVSGPENGPITSVSQTGISQVSVCAKDGIISVTGAQGAITLTSLPGISKKINAQAGVTEIPVDVAGLYIVSVNGKSYKVLVP